MEKLLWGFVGVILENLQKWSKVSWNLQIPISACVGGVLEVCQSIDDGAETALTGRL